ncbi:MAG TPA: hypothetical protein QF571_02600 [Desulfobacterales bacterium]|jgi:hypothetical protein|nr:hypothetical protein [Desulfobacterales bacterium]MDP7354474.1 hypothetical protein [Desulfobacterales bacterium]HJO61698.1 hypothetical protein [Desulfobacterales bacterium]|tara:strand:+ start:1364 stop:1651 length:288 start_codon:yes stop_codon:yes gene_type:complete
MTHHHHLSDHREIESILSFDEKLSKLLKHWLKHNESHARTYRDWSIKAKENEMPEAGALIEAAADMARLINAKFEKAIHFIKHQQKRAVKRNSDA